MVGKNDFVVFVIVGRGLEVHDGRLALYRGDEVHDADEGQFD